MAVSRLDSTFYEDYNRLKLQSYPTKITFAKNQENEKNIPYSNRYRNL